MSCSVALGYMRKVLITVLCILLMLVPEKFDVETIEPSGITALHALELDQVYRS